MPVLGAERKVDSVGRTQEHVGVWMCWVRVRVRREVRRVWKVDGRRMGRVRARDSIVWFAGWEGATGGGEGVRWRVVGGVQLWRWAGDDGDGVAAENLCQDASGLRKARCDGTPQPLNSCTLDCSGFVQR